MRPRKRVGDRSALAKKYRRPRRLLLSLIRASLLADKRRQPDAQAEQRPCVDVMTSASSIRYALSGFGYALVTDLQYFFLDVADFVDLLLRHGGCLVAVGLTSRGSCVSLLWRDQVRIGVAPDRLILA